jgi:two-component system nitrogen regulation response regulator NtrX
MTNNTVLIIDDEADIRELTRDILEDEGFSCATAADSLGAFEEINKRMPSVVLLDIWLQGSELDGLGILEILKQKYSNLPVIMISGHGTIETAVNSIKLGAYDYIEKPFTADKLLITVKRAHETLRLKKENSELRKKVVSKLEFIGNSQAVNQLKSVIEKVAPTSSRILLSGQSGVGKELVARIIHKKSKRMSFPFVTLNASLLNDENVNAELFGDYNKDTSSKYNLGIFELANKGTLFIDEVADMPISIQKRILKFLKDQSVDKSAQGKLDVRIIASTSKDLNQEIKNGNFLQELYYRLNVVSIQVPSLKDRKEDIPLLCDYFLKYFEKTVGFSKKTINEDAIAAMQAYNWPGNIRQLKNTIEWLLIMTSGANDSVIKAESLPQDIISQGINVGNKGIEMNVDMLSLPLREAREIFEKQYLSAQMARFNNNISKTSLFVGMERSALHRKLKLLSIHNNYNDSEEKDSEGPMLEAALSTA